MGKRTFEEVKLLFYELLKRDVDTPFSLDVLNCLEHDELWVHWSDEYETVRLKSIYQLRHSEEYRELTDHQVLGGELLLERMDKEPGKYMCIFMIRTRKKMFWVFTDKDVARIVGILNHTKYDFDKHEQKVNEAASMGHPSNWLHFTKFH